MRRREATIDENKYAYEKQTVSTEVIENFKKEFSPKIMLEIEPLLNAILTNMKINQSDKDKLVTSIEQNINLYYYMNTELLIKIINHTHAVVKNLKKLQHKNTIEIDSEEYNQLDKAQKEIYKIRYDNLIERYATYLIQVLS